MNSEFIYECHMSFLRSLERNTLSIYEVKMNQIKIKNEPDLYVQLPRKNRGFVVEETIGSDHILKCYRDDCNVKAHCIDGRFFVQKDSFHSHGPDDDIIAAKLLKQKMNDLIENIKKSQQLKKRSWNHSTESYIQKEIIPKLFEFQNILSEKLGDISNLFCSQFIQAFGMLFDGIAKPFFDSIISSLQDLNLNKDDSFVDVNACKKAFFEEIMSTKSSFLKEVNSLYKKVFEAIIPKHMESLQEKLNLFVGKIGSTFIISNGGGSEMAAKIAKSTSNDRGQ